MPVAGCGTGKEQAGISLTKAKFDTALSCASQVVVSGKRAGRLSGDGVFSSGQTGSSGGKRRCGGINAGQLLRRL